jgi:hypothetical protein
MFVPVFTPPDLTQKYTQSLRNRSLPEVNVTKQQIPQAKIDEYCQRLNYTDMPITPENTSKRKDKASPLPGGLEAKSKSEQVYGALLTKIENSKTDLTGLDSKIFKDSNSARSYQTRINAHHLPGDKFSLTAFHQPGGKNVLTFITNNVNIGNSRLAELTRLTTRLRPPKGETTAASGTNSAETENVASSAASTYSTSSGESSLEEGLQFITDDVFLAADPADVKKKLNSDENPFRDEPNAQGKPAKPPIPDRSKKPTY